MTNLSCFMDMAERTRMPDEKQILFICTGNTCRSPMAAAVYNACYAAGLDRAYSAGLAAQGSAISPYAAEALADAGIRSTPDNPYLCHISHTVTRDDMMRASLVVAMTGEHAMQLLLAFPAYATKITVMADEIPDPYGGDITIYKQCLAAICTAMKKMFRQNNGVEGEV